ncbi:MAG: hypothetical protein ACJ705_03270 [Nitrososphaeraceae archaeon]
MKLVQLDDITKIYQELGSGVWDFVKLCKEAKTAKMGIPQVINLLRIANNYLPSVQRRCEELQKQNNLLDSIVTTKDREIQILDFQIRDRRKELDAVRSEYVREAALLQGLQQQRAKVEAFVYNYKNYNEEYIEVIKSIENKVHDCLSGKKSFLKLAIFSLIHSMRNNPEKYSALVYHNNDNQNPPSSTSDNILSMKSSRQVILPPPPYDEYIIEDYKAIVLDEAEKLYNVLVDQLVCDVISENVAKQSAETMPSSLPALPLEEGRSDDDKQN